MKAFLQALLLLLTAGVWSQIAPAAPAEAGGRGSEESLLESELPDCDGLPGAPGARESLRAFTDPGARPAEMSLKLIAWLGDGASGATTGPKPSMWSSQARTARGAIAFQPHLRTNGAADAHGSRA